MDLDSPPMVVQTPGKTPEWTATTTTAEESSREETEDSVQDMIDVIKSMEVDQCTDIGLTVAEQQLLRDTAVAVMEDAATLPVSAGQTAPAVIDKEAEVERRLAEARTKQQQIEARCQTLLRRAGRLQSRHVGRHVADQVAHFVTYAKETLSIGAKGRGGHHGAAGSNLYGWAEDGRLPTREEVRNIPTATLVNLVSRLQAPPVSYLSNRRYFGLTNRSTAPSTGQQQQHSTNNNQTGRQLSSQIGETLEEVAGLWEAQLRYLQRHDDPDATESSSGGESDDETTPPTVIEPFLPTPTSTATSTSNEAGGIHDAAAAGSAAASTSSHAGSISTPVSGPPTPAPKPVST